MGIRAALGDFLLKGKVLLEIGVFVNVLSLLVSTGAALVALYAILHQDLKGIRARPRLTLDLRDSARVSSDVRSGYWVRIPVSNARGKYTAINVEVLLKSVKIGGNHSPRDFFPQRLRWTNTNARNCERLHAGAHRLIDLGYCVPRTVETLPQFFVAGETGNRLLTGDADHLIITLLVSGDNFDAFEEEFKVSFSSGGFPPVFIA